MPTINQLVRKFERVPLQEIQHLRITQTKLDPKIRRQLVDERGGHAAVSSHGSAVRAERQRPHNTKRAAPDYEIRQKPLDGTGGDGDQRSKIHTGECRGETLDPHP